MTGSQGVVIPASNAVNVVLRQDVADAIAAGQFHIYSVTSVDDAVELLTGVAAGEPDDDGSYSPDTLYGKVMTQLEAFNRVLLERGHIG